jgi:FkbM family methyltransferase
MLRVFLNRLPLTRIKVSLARVLYALMHSVDRRDERIIRRNGIVYAVDLREGLDLSLFLFGTFQRHVTHASGVRIESRAPVILDIGANVGIMSLTFAARYPQAIVYAFEPTDYAFRRLQRNLALNPHLASRIRPIKAFVSQRTARAATITAYSSWPLTGAAERHPVHRGTAQPATATPAVTLDGFCRDQALARIDLVKIDTDGHEFEVFLGAREALKKYRPFVVFEVGRYVMDDKGIDFGFYERMLLPLGYTLRNSSTGTPIHSGNARWEIPAKGTIDVAAIPPVPEPVSQVW